MKITTAMFFRPGGKSTQHSGVTADVIIPTPFLADDFGEKTQRYSLPEKEVAPFHSNTANSFRLDRHWNEVTAGQILWSQERPALLTVPARGSPRVSARS